MSDRSSPVWQQRPDGSGRWQWPREVRPILVVEDDEALRQLLVETLEAAGHPVVAASNGAAALEAVRRRPPGLILLDLTMPVMDGRAFLDAYRQLPPPHAPVVVCTAHPDPVGHSVRLGASDYLRKRPRPLHWVDQPARRRQGRGHPRRLS